MKRDPGFEERLKRVFRQVTDEIWSDTWGDSIPSNSEFADVIIDRSFHQLNDEDRERLHAMGKRRLKDIATSIK